MRANHSLAGWRDGLSISRGEEPMITQMKEHDARIAEAKWTAEADPHAAADAAEHRKMAELNNVFFAKSALANLEEGKIGIDFGSSTKVHHGEDPRLPKMPEQP